MLEVAADSNALAEDVHRSLRWPRRVVVKHHLLMHPIADRCSLLPPRCNGAEEIMSDSGEAVYLAVAARQKKLEHVGGKRFHGGERQTHTLRGRNLTRIHDVG